MVKISVLTRISIFFTCCSFGLLFLANCSKEESLSMGESETDPKPKVPALTDSYTYTALRNDGTLFEIGNETGVIKKVGKIPQITFNLAFNTVTSSESTTYMYEWMPEIISDGSTTGFRGQLCELDHKTLSSKCTVLDFSNNGIPEYAGLIALDWDFEHKQLIGIVRDIVNGSSGNLNYLVRIDPQTLAITYTGIQFVQDFINATSLVGNTYYISSRLNTFNREPIFSSLDLSTGTQNIIGTSNLDSPPFLLSQNKGAKKLFGLAWKFNTGFTNAAVPIVFDIDSQKFEKLPNTTSISFKQDVGKSFFNSFSNEQIVLIDSEKGGLLTYNFDNNTIKIIQLSPLINELSSLVAIINVK
jgi:hypothetical protein